MVGKDELAELLVERAKIDAKIAAASKPPEEEIAKWLGALDAVHDEFMKFEGESFDVDLRLRVKVGKPDSDTFYNHFMYAADSKNPYDGPGFALSIKSLQPRSEMSSMSKLFFEFLSEVCSYDEIFLENTSLEIRKLYGEKYKAAHNKLLAAMKELKKYSKSRQWLWDLYSDIKKKSKRKKT